ncbi:hypothetical protein FKW77_009543 [Venturia effusa]|uniref:Uncharacterized protein n=1 Tax=Venturia effusa TaxID=50376 RepID=A0A517LBQ5_9PEZI|nr:hypothetical protein FKW77_009543 [Venturia effusa]
MTYCYPEEREPQAARGGVPGGQPYVSMIVMHVMLPDHAEADPTRPTTATAALIALVDHTETPAEEDGLATPSTASEQPPQPTKSLTGTISRNLTHASLRPPKHRYQKSRWQEGRESRSSNISSDGYPPSALNDGQNSTTAPPLPAEDDGTWGQGRMERNLSRHMKGFARKPGNNTKHVNDENSQLDMLYENQRGLFFFGIPKFSSNSLLQFDPSSWVGSDFKPSAVDITNAQVPDPSWEWAWRTWNDTLVEGHALNSDYFTIHSQPRPRSSVGCDDESSVKAAQVRSPNKIDGTRSPEGAADDEDDDDDYGHDGDVRDIPALLRGLKRASIDREKIVLIEKFLHQAGDELYYLSENMSDIMSLLVFQGSRRQLLSILMNKIASAKAHREEHKARHEPEDAAEGRYIDNMLNAFEAADAHCKRLEYWSDLRAMSRNRAISGDAAQGWGHVWQSAGSVGRESRVEDGQPRPYAKAGIKGKGHLESEVFHIAEENVTKKLAEEEQDDRQMVVAKKLAESRQLTEVGDPGVETAGDRRSPAKLTAFSDH